MTPCSATDYSYNSRYRKHLKNSSILIDTDMYSEEMKRQFKRYEELCFKRRTEKENEEFLRAKTELELMAPASKELFIAFRKLEEKRKDAKND